MSVPTFPLKAAAALFLERQQLDRPRGRRLTAASLLSFAESTGGIQLDSINVVDRAHHLTLWSRFGPYDRAKLDRLVYRRRVLFEYWSHVACLVPITDFPAWRRNMLDYARRSKGWGAFLKKHPKLIAAVEDAVREHGPIGSKHFEQAPRKREAGWWNWKPSSHALDYLWMSGRIGVHSRVHFHKRFDLMERILPAELAKPAFSREEYVRWHVRRSLRAMGAATETDLRMYLNYPRIPSAERHAALRRLVAEGAVAEVALAGVRGRWFALREDLEALAAAGRRRAPSRGATFLAPFDSLLWHRERASKLFGFDYRVEVYVPAHKRVHGYYALPIFVDGQLVGRVDAKNHREERRLELRRFHFEPWFVAGDAPPAASWGRIEREEALAAIGGVCRSLAAFLGAEDVRLGKVAPGALAAPLRRALAAAPEQTLAGAAAAVAED